MSQTRASNVYVLKPRGLPLVKVGCSVQPEKRRAVFQKLWSVPLDLCSSVPGTRRDETDLHKELAVWRVEGEWFVLCEAVKVTLSERGLEVPDDQDADRVLTALCKKIDTWLTSHEELGSRKEWLFSVCRSDPKFPSITGEDIRQLVEFDGGERPVFSRQNASYLVGLDLLAPNFSMTNLGRTLVDFVRSIFQDLEKSLLANNLGGWAELFRGSALAAVLVDALRRAALQNPAYRAAVKALETLEEDP